MTMSERETYRKSLTPAFKELDKLMEAVGASFDLIERIRDCSSFAATQLGIQPKDLKLVGEFEVFRDTQGKKVKEKLSKVFYGFEDPNPDPELRGKLISVEEAVSREWKHMNWRGN